MAEIFQSRQTQESEDARIEGPKPYRPFLRTEEAARWMGVRVEEFEAMMGRFLPTLRKIRLGKRDERWDWMDIAVLEHVLTRSASRFPDAAAPVEREKPKPLPEGSPIPEKLLPVADSLTREYDGPVVYFLIFRGEVVYVGISTTPDKRVAEHKNGSNTTERKEFDYYLYYPVALDNMLAMERNFVAILDPVLNKNLKTKF